MKLPNSRGDRTAAEPSPADQPLATRLRKEAKIRLATPGDAEALGTIQYESHRATYQGIMPDSVLARQRRELLIERFSTRLAAAVDAAVDDLQRLWVIEEDGAIAGYARTEPGANRFLPPPEGAGEMESLYLRPGAIGRGLGRELHRHAIDDLVGRGFDPLILWAFAANWPARRFYERAGWILDVAGENWVLDGVSCPIVRYRMNRPQTSRPTEGTGP